MSIFEIAISVNALANLITACIKLIELARRGK